MVQSCLGIKEERLCIFLDFNVLEDGLCPFIEVRHTFSRKPEIAYFVICSVATYRQQGLCFVLVFFS